MMEKKKAKDFKDYNNYEEILNGYEPIFLNQDFISWNKDKYEGCRDSLISYLIGYNFNFSRFLQVEKTFEYRFKKWQNEDENCEQNVNGYKITIEGNQMFYDKVIRMWTKQEKEDEMFKYVIQDYKDYLFCYIYPNKIEFLIGSLNK